MNRNHLNMASAADYSSFEDEDEEDKELLADVAKIDEDGLPASEAEEPTRVSRKPMSDRLVSRLLSKMERTSGSSSIINIRRNSDINSSSGKTDHSNNSVQHYRQVSSSAIGSTGHPEQQAQAGEKAVKASSSSAPSDINKSSSRKHDFLLSPAEPPQENQPDFITPPKCIPFFSSSSNSRRDDPRRLIGNYGEFYSVRRTASTANPRGGGGNSKGGCAPAALNSDSLSGPAPPTSKYPNLGAVVHEQCSAVSSTFGKDGPTRGVVRSTTTPEKSSAAPKREGFSASSKPASSCLSLKEERLAVKSSPKIDVKGKERRHRNPNLHGVLSPPFTKADGTVLAPHASTPQPKNALPRNSRLPVREDPNLLQTSSSSSSSATAAASSEQAQLKEPSQQQQKREETVGKALHYDHVLGPEPSRASADGCGGDETKEQSRLEQNSESLSSSAPATTAVRSNEQTQRKEPPPQQKKKAEHDGSISCAESSKNSVTTTFISSEQAQRKVPPPQLKKKAEHDGSISCAESSKNSATTTIISSEQAQRKELPLQHKKKAEHDGSISCAASSKNSATTTVISSEQAQRKEPPLQHKEIVHEGSISYEESSKHPFEGDGTVKPSPRPTRNQDGEKRSAKRSKWNIQPDGAGPSTSRASCGGGTSSDPRPCEPPAAVSDPAATPVERWSGGQEREQDEKTPERSRAVHHETKEPYTSRTPTTAGETGTDKSGSESAGKGSLSFNPSPPRNLQNGSLTMHDRRRASPCRPSRWWARASQDDQLERKIRRFRNNAWEILEKNRGPMSYPEFITALRSFDYVEMDMKLGQLFNGGYMDGLVSYRFPPGSSGLYFAIRGEDHYSLQQTSAGEAEREYRGPPSFGYYGPQEKLTSDVDDPRALKEKDEGSTRRSPDEESYSKAVSPERSRRVAAAKGYQGRYSSPGGLSSGSNGSLLSDSKTSSDSGDSRRRGRSPKPGSGRRTADDYNRRSISPERGRWGAAGKGHGSRKRYSSPGGRSSGSNNSPLSGSGRESSSSGDVRRRGNYQKPMRGRWTLDDYDPRAVSPERACWRAPAKDRQSRRRYDSPGGRYSGSNSSPLSESEKDSSSSELDRWRGGSQKSVRERRVFDDYERRAVSPQRGRWGATAKRRKGRSRYDSPGGRSCGWNSSFSSFSEKDYSSSGDSRRRGESQKSGRGRRSSDDYDRKAISPERGHWGAAVKRHGASRRYASPGRRSSSSNSSPLSSSEKESSSSGGGKRRGGSQKPRRGRRMSDDYDRKAVSPERDLWGASAKRHEGRKRYGSPCARSSGSNSSPLSSSEKESSSSGYGRRRGGSRKWGPGRRTSDYYDRNAVSPAEQGRCGAAAKGQGRKRDDLPGGNESGLNHRPLLDSKGGLSSPESGKSSPKNAKTYLESGKPSPRSDKSSPTSGKSSRHSGKSSGRGRVGSCRDRGEKSGGHSEAEPKDNSSLKRELGRERSREEPRPKDVCQPVKRHRDSSSVNEDRGVKSKVSRADIAIAKSKRVDSSVVKKKIGGGEDPPHGQANGGSLSPDKMRLVIKSTVASIKKEMEEDDGVKGKGANEDVEKCGLGVGVSDDAETPARKAKAPSTKSLADRKRGATEASIGSSAVAFVEKGTEGGGDSAAGLPSSVEKALKRMSKKRPKKKPVAAIFRTEDDPSTKTGHKKVCSSP